MLIWKAAALALVTCVIALVLKKDQPAYAFLASAAGAICLLVLAAQRLTPLLEWIHTLSEYGIAGSSACLLQVLGIALIGQFASDLCREAGLSAAASAVDLCGRLLALLQAVPMLQSLLASFSGFLQG